MAYEGWMTLGGTELVNAARLGAYMQGGMPGLLDDCDGCENLTDALGDLPYTNPLNDLAPWVSPNDPDTWDFYGLKILSMTGIDDPPRDVDISQALGNGGFTTRNRFKTKEFRIRASMYACTHAGLEAGATWLRRAVEGACGDGCSDGSTVCFLATCPTEVGEGKGDLVTTRIQDDQITTRRREGGGAPVDGGLVEGTGTEIGLWGFSRALIVEEERGLWSPAEVLGLQEGTIGLWAQSDVVGEVKVLATNPVPGFAGWYTSGTGTFTVVTPQQAILDGEVYAYPVADRWVMEGTGDFHVRFDVRSTTPSNNANQQPDASCAVTFNYDVGSQGRTVAFPADGEWHTIEAGDTPDPAATEARLFLSSGTPYSSDTYEVRNLQYRMGDGEWTPLFTGDTVSTDPSIGYRWTGTPGESTSEKVTGTVKTYEGPRMGPDLPCDEIRWNWTLSSTTSQGLATVYVYSDGQVISETIFDVTPARASYQVTDSGVADRSRVWTEVVPGYGVEVHALEVIARNEDVPTVYDPCENRYFRQIRATQIIDGPNTLRERKFVSGGWLREVEMIFVATTPWVYGLDRKIASLGPGQVTSYNGGTASESDFFIGACERNPEPEMILDPECPPSAPLPQVPFSSSACEWIDEEDYTNGYEVKIPGDAIPSWADAVATVRIESSGRAVRGVRVRFFALLGNQQELTDLDPCEACGGFLVDYIPPNTTLVVDGMTERSYFEYPNAVTRSASHLVSSTGYGGGMSWPLMSCETPYMAVVEVASTALERLDLSITTRE